MNAGQAIFSRWLAAGSKSAKALVSAYERSNLSLLEARIL